jgi:hypothetical protein
MDIDTLIDSAKIKHEFLAVEFLKYVKETANKNNISINDAVTYLLSCKQTTYKKNLLNILRQYYPDTNKKYVSIFNAKSINISKISIVQNKNLIELDEIIKEKPIQHRPADVEGKAGTLKIG